MYIQYYHMNYFAILMFIQTITICATIAEKYILKYLLKLSKYHSICYLYMLRNFRTANTVLLLCIIGREYLY